MRLLDSSRFHIYDNQIMLDRNGKELARQILAHFIQSLSMGSRGSRYSKQAVDIMEEGTRNHRKERASSKRTYMPISVVRGNITIKASPL